MRALKSFFLFLCAGIAICNFMSCSSGQKCSVTTASEQNAETVSAIESMLNEAWKNRNDRIYCSSSYNEALAKAMDLANSIDDLGPIDYDHYAQAQDEDDLTLEVLSIEVLDSISAMAKVTVINFGQPKTITLPLVCEGEKWLIDDFIVDGRSEKEIIKGYIKE